MTGPAAVMPRAAPPDRGSIDELLERIASLASLLYTVQIALDSLVLDSDPSTHDHERAGHARHALDEALLQTRALGVAIAD